jgi:hypothetical protein
LTPFLDGSKLGYPEKPQLSASAGIGTNEEVSPVTEEMRVMPFGAFGLTFGPAVL